MTENARLCASHTSGAQLAVLANVNCLLLSGLQLTKATGAGYLREGALRQDEAPAPAAAAVRDGVGVGITTETRFGTVSDIGITHDFHFIRHPAEIPFIRTKS